MPESIGAYKVIKELGRGGMGVVYEVVDSRKPGPSLALKLIRSDDDLALKRFGREIELLGRVRHGNLIQIHEIGRGAQGPFMVTDMVEGENLQTVCRRGALPAQQAAEVMRGVASAMATVSSVIANRRAARRIVAGSEVQSSDVASHSTWNG